MGNTKKCLIVGLPDAGKSTYIGAFWAIEKDGKTNHKLTCKEYPSDTTYLDTLKKSWLEQSIVKRSTNNEPQDIFLKLHSESTGEELELHIPDFKGEAFQRIISNNHMEKVSEWCNSADCILYFMKCSKPDILQDEMPSSADQSEVGDELIKKESMQVDNISELIQNIMLLKYLHAKVSRDIPLTICFSAWDKISTEKTIVEWVKSELPLLHNFITHHFSNIKYYGVSAQGLEYSDNEFEEYQRLTDLKQRAYIYTTERSYDITEPFEFLITQ